MKIPEIIEHLCLTIGERHLGSPGEKATIEWLEARFEALGYKTHRETFEAPGWEYGAFAIRTAEGLPIDAFPCYFSPGGEVSAPLQIYTGKEPLEQFRGKIAFAGRHDFEHVGDTNALAEALENAGAAALILNSPYNDTVSTKIIRNPALQRMPVFTVSQRTALKLAREAGKPLHLQLEARRFPHRSANLVARYPGLGKRKLVIGAHYDTAPGIQGAADNATGIALLIHLAGLLKSHLGEWSVDFVAFGAEEYGGPGYGLGGYEYMNAHQGEPIDAMICLDNLGTYLGKPEARVGRSGRLRQWVREETQFYPGPFRKGSDQGIFDLHGIPTVWFSDGGGTTGVGHFPQHSPQDTTEIVDFTKLEAMGNEIGRFILRLLQEGIPAEPHAEIVPLEEKDRAEVIALVREVWTMGMAHRREQEYGSISGSPWQDQIAHSVESYLAEKDVLAVKAVVDGCFAGFLAYEISPGLPFGQIGYNAVDPNFGGRGLGQRLLSAALDKMREAGLRYAEVITGLDDGHAPARRMYERAGFREFTSSIRYTLPL